MRRPLFAALALSAIGCATTHAEVSALDAEVRRLRTEQERQAAQIDQIRNRLMLTEEQYTAWIAGMNSDPDYEPWDVGIAP